MDCAYREMDSLELLSYYSGLTEAHLVSDSFRVENYLCSASTSLKMLRKM